MNVQQIALLKWCAILMGSHTYAFALCVRASVRVCVYVYFSLFHCFKTIGFGTEEPAIRYSFVQCMKTLQIPSKIIIPFCHIGRGWQIQFVFVIPIINSILFIVQHDFTLCYCKIPCHDQFQFNKQQLWNLLTNFYWCLDNSIVQ